MLLGGHRRPPQARGEKERVVAGRRADGGAGFLFALSFPTLSAFSSLSLSQVSRFHTPPSRTWPGWGGAADMVWRLCVCGGSDRAAAGTEMPETRSSQGRLALSRTRASVTLGGRRGGGGVRGLVRRGSERARRQRTHRNAKGTMKRLPPLFSDSPFHHSSPSAVPADLFSLSSVQPPHALGACLLCAEFR